jgi:flagellar assembly protein FliH
MMSLSDLEHKEEMEASERSPVSEDDTVDLEEALAAKESGMAAVAGPEEAHDFMPINVKTLEKFDGEVSNKTPETPPDFDRFKLLFDPSELAQEKVSFEELYAFASDEVENTFEPLIEGAGDAPEYRGVAGDSDPEIDDPEGIEPEKTPEELGFEKGLKKGLDQGRVTGEAEGQTKGFDQGFATGEAEGQKKGEADGFAKGEAEGREKGYEQGRQKAEAEVAEEAEQILKPLREGLETVDQLMNRLVKRYELQIMELIQKIAEKAVKAKIDTDDEVIKNVILEALTNLVAPEEVSLSVSTEDYEYVEMIKDEFFEAMRSLKHVAISSDPMINKGGCRIETATATISTDPETKLAAVYDAIVKAGR